MNFPQPPENENKLNWPAAKSPAQPQWPNNAAHYVWFWLFLVATHEATVGGKYMGNVLAMEKAEYFDVTHELL